MRFWPLLAAAWRRSKTRTALTALSVVVAFILYGYLAAIDRAFAAGVSVAGAERIVVRHKASIVLPLPAFYESRIEEIAGVIDATHATWFGAVYRDSRNYFSQLAVDPVAYFAMYPDLALHPEAAALWRIRREGAVAGRALAERFGWQVGDRVSLRTTLWPRSDGAEVWEFVLVGIYDGMDSAVNTNQFFFRFDYFDAHRRDEVAQGVGWYIVRVGTASEAPAVADAIERRFANSPNETRAESELAFVQSFVNQVGDVGLILKAILAAVLGTLALVVTNAMHRAIRERREELALLKAVGFGDRLLLLMVSFECCGLSLGAGFVGLGVSGWLIGQGDPTGGALPVFELPVAAWLHGMAWAFGLGLTAAVPGVREMLRVAAAPVLRGTA